MGEVYLFIFIISAQLYGPTWDLMHVCYASYMLGKPQPWRLYRIIITNICGI